ncbi:MAG: phosphohydrolase [Bacteroidetes bacterium]|nr:MAG: phosphohydrolase [Bacteroidota bacterium]
MRKILENIRNYYSEIYKVLLFVFTVVIIVLLFPESTKFRYEYSEGRPWLYENLESPVDFAIKKTDTEIEKELENIKNNSKLFFSFDQNKTEKILNNISSSFDTLWLQTYGLGNRESYASTKQLCLDISTNVYQTGIIKLPTDIPDNHDDVIVYVLRNNIAKEAFLNYFYSPKTAYQFVLQELEKSSIIDKDFIANFVHNHLKYNVFIDRKKTELELENSLNNISPNRGIILQGQHIVNKGEIISDDIYSVLESLNNDFQNRSHSSSIGLYIGKIILVSFPLIAFGLFMFFFRPDIFEDSKNLIMIFILIISMVVVTRIIVVYDGSLVLLIPLMISPIVIRAFYDTSLALIVHLTTVILISFVVPDSFIFVFLELMTGIIAIISVVKLHKRSQFFFSALYIFLSFSVIYIGVELITETTLVNIDIMVFAYFAVSAGLTLLATPIIYVFEKLFGMVTDVSLLEYADTNNTLIRKLSTIAPGTFNHSIQVSNLAEEAAAEIGANQLLVRAGAMYHDIGKMENPMFFTENQNGNYSPHDELSYQESADIILSHVLDGVKIAKKNNLPNQIIDFIRTHHGTKRVEYFYRMHLKEMPDEEVKLREFTYRGPIPYSKETCILMMADAVEAASRSIKSPDAKSISELVDSIIKSQLEQGQYNNANISLREINTAKKVFKKKLLNIYHIRIEYPD